jgi:ABC-2 type transport system permease protein
MLMSLLIICGVIIFYSIYISIASLVFKFGSFDSFPSVFNILTIPLLVPTDVYGYSANLILTFLLPLAFVVTIPAKVMVDKAGPGSVLIGILMAVLCLGISTKVWNRSIRHYSSASS